MNVEIRNIDISQIQPNKGQIKGLPKNPRFIRDARLKALVKSIQDAPEMLELSELKVYPFKGKYVAIGGNMRLKACQELGIAEIPCKVLPSKTPIKKLREYAIKDNEPYGENDWDILANEWDEEELKSWGLDLPTDWDANMPSVDDDSPKKSKTESIDDDDAQGKKFSCKIIFDSKESFDDFLLKYEPLIADEFCCSISISGGK